MPLYIHIISGGTALLVGGVNITRAYLHRRRGHRVLGSIYTIAIAISVPAPIVVALNSYAGAVPYGRVIGTSGFTVLAIAWLVALIVAVLAAVRGSVQTHREWITISFALTFAAVTLRVEVIALLIFGHRAFESSYPFLAWTCWIPNVLVAMVILRVQRRCTIAQMPRSREGEPEADQHAATVGRSPYA